MYEIDFGVEFIVIKLSINSNLVKSQYFSKILENINRYRLILQTFFCRIKSYLSLKRRQRNIQRTLGRIHRNKTFDQ